MKLTDYQTLEYLHDSLCHEIVWDCKNPNRRVVHLFVTDDAGFACWNGKSLFVTLTDAVAVHFVGWGFCTGEETIDAWREGTSCWLEEKCKSLSESGIRVPSLRFSISFHSGSILEVACSEISVDEKG